MTGGGRGNVSNYFCFDLDHSFFGANDSLELVFDIFGHYTSDLYSGVFTPSLPNYHLLSGNNAGNGHSQTMKSLLERGAGSDLKLVVMKKKKQQEQQQQDQQQPGTANDDDDADDNSVTTFNVHQLYLTAHSVVFEAMLLRNGNTREAQERRVVIRDLSAKTVHSLLLFIYTGALAAEEDFTLELLSAADKYEVTALKVACEQQLSLQLTTDSVFAHLVHADRHNAPTLKENCL
ncbi:PREDICTED: BTB and MATH domain-containing protein 40-like, partial [Rhagoletis zephyria]|uniref:BTB and MATH domain-containing protein 40-like n=1 Tax=Rhagoletis zephyria TaxID=28612 RepID=UPI0008112153